jgi:hypothetical protein
MTFLRVSLHFTIEVMNEITNFGIQVLSTWSATLSLLVQRVRRSWRNSSNHRQNVWIEIMQTSMSGEAVTRLSLMICTDLMARAQKLDVAGRSSQL